MKPEHGSVLDILGIGFGPANIALAIALEERGSWNSVRFLERRNGPTWHPDMLLDGADIQNNPLRDFVTPRNPRSHYTFVNYLHSQGRLFDYLNLGLAFPLRKDYARYIEWVARQFDAVVEYDTEVASIGLGGAPSAYGGRCYEVRTKNGARHLARSLVVGIGRSPNIPDVFRSVLGPRVFHFTEYLARIRHGTTNGRCPYRRICVVGGSQSSVEIVLDLMTRYPDCEVVNVMRNYGYRLKDTSPFSEHVYFPEFVDYFFDASPASKARLWEELKYTNYSSADADVIHGLYLKLYEQKLDGRENVRMMPNRTVERVSSGQDGIAIEVREVHTGAVDVMTFDAVVLATGFRNFGSGESREGYPLLLEGVVDRLRLTSADVLHIGRDYDLEGRDGADEIPPIYLNGLCESSHGFGDAGSFSLLSVRSETIARSLARRLNGNGSALGRRRDSPAFARKGDAIGDAYGSRSDTRPVAGG
jgi:L-ornithine N5-oxygenase